MAVVRAAPKVHCKSCGWGLKPRIELNAERGDMMKNWILALILGAFATFMYFSFMIKLW